MLQEVDDMTTGVLEKPPSSPTQYASVMRKVQTNINRCMISIRACIRSTAIPCWSTGACTYAWCSWGEKGTHRLLDGWAHRGRVPAPPHLGGRGQSDPGHGGERGRGSGRRRHGDPGSCVPPSPFENPDLDVMIFSLGLTPFALSYSSGAGTSYVPPDPFNIPDADYISMVMTRRMMLSWHNNLALNNVLGDSENVRDAYGLYFTRAAKKTWTFTRMVTHNELMVSDEPSMLYPDVEEDDEDDDDADEDYDISSESDNNNKPNDKEDYISTPVNPLSYTIVNQ
ncbi:hypothetical protein M9H77_07555 [Catharanthus roseus]|uniref:Uncharacterized protein n=1 Tax=Catharanthus roseus TaxID=4058 RepID=A0ACC0BVF7_CATRO|nr:hypothetical protein M9H77_07555 [Catharanthus roseus]